MDVSGPDSSEGYFLVFFSMLLMHNQPYSGEGG